MPFPWKKAKVTRISRLVADLQQSPKHGGSLVVETGFPTSLIDLFVKNRDRLRKSPKRKPRPPHQIQTQSHSPPIIIAPPSSPSSSFPSSPCAQNPQSSSSDVDSGEIVLIEESERECEEEGIAFHAALFKIFVVTALAVSTTNLAIWIMAAAFLLVLIEFVGTRLFGFWKPSSWIRKGFLLLKRWDCEQARSSSSSSAVAATAAAEEQEGNSDVFPESCRLIEMDDGEEIEIAEPKLNYQSLETQIRVEEEEMEKSSESLILVSKAELSRKAKIRRIFIKKFVPKKLRNAKKESLKIKKGKKDELDEIEEEKQVGSNHDDSNNDKNGEDECELQQTEEERCKEIEHKVSISTSVQHLSVESDKEIIKVKNTEKSGYSILFMIVLPLVGLVAGRGVALMLTLLWCLMVRYIARLRRC